MADIKGIVLNKILNKEEGFLEAWSKIKLGYFGTEYAAIYKVLSKFYIKHQGLPSFEDLKLHSRQETTNLALDALAILENPEVSLDLAVEALVNEYTQELVLKELDTFLDGITLLDSSEIKEELGKLMLDIEEKTLSAEEIVLMNDIEFTADEDLLDLMPLYLNNSFDEEVGGAAPTEVIGLGGMRGSGKSSVCSNLCSFQYEQGNSALYFSVEMRAREVFNRFLSILSGVSLSHISRASCDGFELDKVAVARTAMFEDAEDVLEAYAEHQDYPRFEKELTHTKELKKDNQLVIIDNQQLTLANIDLTVQKFKAQFGEKLKLVVVDYLNVIAVEDKYEWKTQIDISAKLKEIARRHNVVLVAPYQIDKTGEARFSKGILDAMDIAMVLDRDKDKISFTSTKTRNMKDFSMVSLMDEATMRIDPDDTKVPQEEPEEEKAKDKPKESNDDVPWT